MNLEDQKISGSRNWAVWGLDFLTRYDPDPLRYYLTVNMPETRDSDWAWEDFLHRNNDELVATWGNLVNRTLAFTYKHWEGILPDPGELRAADLLLLETVETGFDTIAGHFEAVHLRAALGEAMRLAGEVNKYLDTSAPWFEIKTDKAQAAKSVFTAIQAIDWLKTMLSPFLPFTCERLHSFLGYDQPLFGVQSVEQRRDNLGEHSVLRYNPGNASGKWQADRLIGGRNLRQPQPLYRKLEPTIIEEERARLGKQL
jgi:methionyl-tRNA synthetase